MKLINQNENRPGYKETKIGWIPDEWTTNLFKELLNFKNGVNAEKEKYGKGIKFVNIMEVINNNQIFPENIPGSVSLPEKMIKSNDVIKGDILFNRTSETREEIGLSAVYLNNEKVVFGGFVIRGRPINSELDNGYKKYCFQTSVIRKQIIAFGQGAIRTNIGQKDLEKVEIPLPPLPEQKKIATILSTWDKAIEKTTDLIAAKEQQKKGLMQKLLSGKVRFPGFTEPWEEVKLGSLVKEVDRDITWDDNKEYKLVSVRRRSGGLFHRENLFGHQIKTKTLKIIQANDFLISKMQVVHGASGLTTNDYDGMYVSASYHCLVSKNDELIDIEFFNYFSQLSWFYHLTYLASHGVHIEKMTFKLKDLLKFKILIPTDIREQKKIVKVIDGIGDEIKLLKKEKAALEQQKKGLMQKLLTGSVRVGVDKD